MAERTGLEPATPCVTGRYSNQLNYRSLSKIHSLKIHALVMVVAIRLELMTSTL